MAAAALTAGTLASTALLGLAGTAAPAAAAPGTPGTPAAPRTVYAEDFQNVDGPDPILRLDDYAGTSGTTYTADPPWLRGCNGWISSLTQNAAAAAQVADCNDSQGSWNRTQQLASALGVFKGQTPEESRGNYAVSAYTAGNPGAPFVEFATGENIPFVADNRFVAFSVDVAATSCEVAASPLLQFQLVDDGGEAQDAGDEIDGCASTGRVDQPAFGAAGATPVRVGTYTANGAVLFSGRSVGVRMVNNQPTGAGNDHAFDNIRILDVTPQLDKSFAGQAQTGATSTLTFTVTNTSELGSKTGWSFTDELPAGLTVTDPDGIGGTCDAETTATAGGSRIEITDGNLAAQQTSCTITVPVRAAEAGTYENCADGVTTIGLSAPGCTKLEVTDPSFAVSKTSSRQTAQPGDVVTYSVQVKNTGRWAYDDDAPEGFRRAAFTDDLSKVLDDATYNDDATNGATVEGDKLAWSGPLAAGNKITITYSVTVNDPATGDRKLVNTVVAPSEDGGRCATRTACDTATTVTVGTSEPAGPPSGPSVSTGGTVAQSSPVWPWVGIGTLAVLLLIGAGFHQLRRNRPDAQESGD